MADTTYGFSGTGDAIPGLDAWDIMPSGTGSELSWERLVITSLFTDARIDDATRPPDGSTDRRGWWGDTYTESKPAASRLWLVAGKAGPSARAVEDAIRDALAWIIEDGLADAVNVTTTITGNRADTDVEIIAQGEAVVIRVPALWSDYA